jgi:hypothetical protein
MRHTLRHLTLAVTALVAGACAHDTTAAVPDQAALVAAEQFMQIGNDVERNGGDPDVVAGYREIGTTLMQGGRVSPITIAIDGASSDFLAAAQQFEVDAGPTCSQPGSLCLLLQPMRHVIAWDRSNPRRVVQLSSPAGASAGAGASDYSATRVIYFDGSGGIYLDQDVTPALGAPQVSDVPCYPPSQTTYPLPSWSSMEQCTRAEFPVTLDASVAPPPFPVQHNTASGTHTIAIAPQSVHGARVVLTPPAGDPCVSCGTLYPRLGAPPIDLHGTTLLAVLDIASSGAGVTFALRVSNPTPAPVTIQFNSAQQFDMRVRRTDGTILWTWSADKAFTAALTSRTLAGGEVATYSASWTPTTHGSLVAEGFLTSSSHQAGARMGFPVP